MQNLQVGGQIIPFLSGCQGNYDRKSILTENVEDEIVKYVKFEDPSLKDVDLSAKRANDIVMSWLSPKFLVEKLAIKWVEKRLIVLCSDFSRLAWQDKISSIVMPLLRNEPDPPSGQIHLFVQKLYDVVADTLGKEESKNKQLLEDLNIHIKQTMILPLSSIWAEKITATALDCLEKALIAEFRFYQHAYGEQVTICIRERFPDRIPKSILYIHDKL